MSSPLVIQMLEYMEMLAVFESSSREMFEKYGTIETRDSCASRRIAKWTWDYIRSWQAFVNTLMG